MTLSEQQDVRELVGYPRQPLRKLKRNERQLLKKTLAGTTTSEPTIAVRVALTLNAPVAPSSLNTGVIDLALAPEDVVKHLDRLVVPTRLIDATAVLEVLHKKSQSVRAPRVLSALRKLVLPKRGPRQLVPVALTQESAHSVVRLITSLMPRLLKRRSIGSSVPVSMAEIVSAAISDHSSATLLGSALVFLRELERNAGWAALDSVAIQPTVRKIAEFPGMVGAAALAANDIRAADELAKCVRLFQPAEQFFRTQIAETVDKRGPSLPIAGRNWASSYLSDEGAKADAELGRQDALSGDAPHERLALMLMNAWEARNDGKNSDHAYAVAEDVCRVGFDVHIMGKPGSLVEFDPDVHEPFGVIGRGDQCRLVRPWIEWHSPDGIRVLMRGRVTSEKS